jgi:hypothetical protein
MNCNLCNPYSQIWDPINNTYKIDSQNIFSDLDQGVFSDDNKVVTLASNFSLLPIKGQDQFPLNLPFFEFCSERDLAMSSLFAEKQKPTTAGLYSKKTRRREPSQKDERLNSKIRAVAYANSPIMIRFKVQGNSVFQ